MENGATGDEIGRLAQQVEAAGADILNTGIGWHEARVPTIAYPIPRAAWRFAPRRLKRAVSDPGGRVEPHQHARARRRNSWPRATAICSRWRARCWPIRTLSGRFEKATRTGSISASPAIRPASTASSRIAARLVWSIRAPVARPNSTKGRRKSPRRIAVVGAGAGGLAAAAEASRRGHKVTLFEVERSYWRPDQPRAHGPRQSRVRRDAALLRRPDRRARRGAAAQHSRPRRMNLRRKFEAVVVASGVHPRVPEIPGIDHPKVVTYTDLLSGKRNAGRRVAIIGAGGIGFDVAEYLCHSQPGEGPKARGLDLAEFQAEWNVDASLEKPGGLARRPAGAPPAHARDHASCSARHRGRVLRLACPPAGSFAAASPSAASRSSPA